MRADIILIALFAIGPMVVYTQRSDAASQQGGSLRGIVTNDRGQPVRGIKVKVERVGGVPTTVETNKDGRYEVRDLEPGIYTVTLIAPGGFVNRYEVQIETFQPTVRDFSVGFGQGPIAPVPPSPTPNETPGGKRPKPPNESPPSPKTPMEPEKVESHYVVREETVKNEITLNDWFLALEKERTKFVRAVFPKAQGQCLLVLEELGSRQPIHHYVLGVNGPDIRKQLEQKYNNIKNRIIVGTCETEDGSYLIIIRDGKK